MDGARFQRRPMKWNTDDEWKVKSTLPLIAVTPFLPGFFCSPLPLKKLTLFFFGLFRATLAAYGSSQSRGQIGAVAVGLCHSHSNPRSEQCLQTIQQLTTTHDP